MDKIQTQIGRSFLLVTFFIVTVSLSAQTNNKRKYITTGGDTTEVVMGWSTKLQGEDARFLLDPRATDDMLGKHSKYEKLKDAVNETREYRNVFEEGEEDNRIGAGSLGFRIAQKNIEYLQREKEAEGRISRNAKTEMSVDEIAYMKEKYGNRPSYFVNDTEVAYKTAMSIPGKQILSKDFKVINTSTGNPNGEIRIYVNSNTYNKLLDTTNSKKNENLSKATDSSDAKNKKGESIAKEGGKKEKAAKKEKKEEKKSEDWYITPSGVRIDKSSLTPEQRKRIEEQTKELEGLKKTLQEFEGGK